MIIWLSPKEWLKERFCSFLNLCLKKICLTPSPESNDQNDEENRDSCDTCAFRVIVPTSDEEKPFTQWFDKAYKEFKRRHKGSTRIIDIGNPKDKNEFCILGSPHFKKGGRKCKEWIIATGSESTNLFFKNSIDSKTADPFAIYFNKKIHYLTCIILSFTIFTVCLSLYAVLQPHIFKLWQTKTIEQNDNISKSLTSEKEIILLIKSLNMSDIQLKTEKESQNKK